MVERIISKARAKELGIKPTKRKVERDEKKPRIISKARARELEAIKKKEEAKEK